MPKNEDVALIERRRQNELQAIQDHDLLIRLEAKVDGVISDIKEIKDGTSMKIAEHETRIRQLEETNKEVRPITMRKEMDEVYQWKPDFQLTYRVIVGIASAVGG